MGAKQSRSNSKSSIKNKTSSGKIGTIADKNGEDDSSGENSFKDKRIENYGSIDAFSSQKNNYDSHGDKYGGRTRAEQARIDQLGDDMYFH